MGDGEEADFHAVLEGPQVFIPGPSSPLPSSSKGFVGSVYLARIGLTEASKAYGEGRSPPPRQPGYDRPPRVDTGIGQAPTLEAGSCPSSLAPRVMHYVSRLFQWFQAAELFNLSASTRQNPPVTMVSYKGEGSFPRSPTGVPVLRVLWVKMPRSKHSVEKADG